MMQTFEQWKEEKDRILQAAKIRPAMYLGPKGREHLRAIQDALGLVWIAKIFRQAQQATVFLSPHQFVIRCETGPFLRSIQKILSWQGKEILTSDWSEELSQCAKLDRGNCPLAMNRTAQRNPSAPLASVKAGIVRIQAEAHGSPAPRA